MKTNRFLSTLVSLALAAAMSTALLAGFSAAAPALEIASFPQSKVGLLRSIDRNWGARTILRIDAVPLLKRATSGATDRSPFRGYFHHWWRPDRPSGAALGTSLGSYWSAKGDQASGRFGWSAATAGDVNGDGYDDIVVGAPYYGKGQADEGWVFLYYGSAAGLCSTPGWVAEGEQAGARFGWSVAAAGDANGDGYADVIVGAPGYDNGEADEGRAFLFLGSSAGLEGSPAWSGENDQAQAYLGAAVNTAGDVNGDGYDDLLVGVPGYDNDLPGEGQALIYYGSPAGISAQPDWAVEGNQFDSFFGSAVSTAGDVNGDGYDDVIVGAYQYDNGLIYQGLAFAYYVGEGGLGEIADWTAEIDQGGANLGWSVGMAGDVNGDGYGDVVVGAPAYDNDERNAGLALAYYGSRTGLSVVPDWMVAGEQAGASLGNAVNAAGDVNGDGYGDVVVGACHYDGEAADAGHISVYVGSTAGLGGSAAWATLGDQAEASFGYIVGSAGDVNGDGYGDMVVGAPHYDSDQVDAGRVFVFYGEEVAPPVWQVGLPAVYVPSTSIPMDRGKGYRPR